MKKNLSIIFTILFNITLYSAEYYVANTGDDNNDGSAESPWKTVQKAASIAGAGDQVFIKKGTYSGNVNPANSGTSDNWLTFDAFPGDEGLVILDDCEFKITQKSYIRVSGLKVQNGDQGFHIVGPCSNIIISNNHTYDTYGSGITFWGVPWQSDPGDFTNIQDIKILNNKVEKACNGGWNECITLANGIVGFEIAYNEIFNGGDPTNGGEGIDIKEGAKNGKVHHNYLHGLTRRGIYIDAAGRTDFTPPVVSDIEIFNNIVHDCEGQGIAIMTEGTGDVHDVNVYNNILYNNTEDGIMVYKHPNGSGLVYNCSLVNNTIWNNPRFGILINFTDSYGLNAHNNICYENGTNFKREQGEGTSLDNLIGINPNFISTSEGNFRLQKESPAIDAGTSNSAPTIDADSNMRDDGKIDIGAYEFQETTLYIDHPRDKNNMQIFPNPASSYILIEASEQFGNPVSYAIFNSNGVLVSESSAYNNTGMPIKICIENLDNGLYILKSGSSEYIELGFFLVHK